jgi:hypothetical protein
MRYSKATGYDAIAEVLREPLATIGTIESVVEGVMVAIADQGCGVTIPGTLVEYQWLIHRHRI